MRGYPIQKILMRSDVICGINTRRERFKIEGVITSGCCNHGGLIKLGRFIEEFLLGEISSRGRASAQFGCSTSHT